MLLRKSFWRVIGILVLCIGHEAQGARWRLGPENPIEPKGWGVTEKIAIGDGENRTWFWSSGWGISFYPGQDMPDAQTSKELRLGKTAGGKCYWGLTFHFAKPINRFRFTLPRCGSLDFDSGDVYLQYSTDVDPKAKELWRMGAKSPGYQKGGGLEPIQLAWVELSKPVNVLALSFVLEGFIGNMQFYDGVDDGGVLEYSVPNLPVEQMTRIQLIPDGKETANIYRLDDPLRAFIDVGPALLPEPPVIGAADIGRGKTLTIKTEVLGTGYLAELSSLPSGCYELSVRVQSQGKSVTVPGPRIIRVRPARVLTWSQILQSPFGVNAIEHNPSVARLIGVHPLRGGSPTWVTASPAKDVYALDFDPKTVTLSDVQNGYVRSHNVAFSPGWAVDPNTVAPGSWPGYCAPKAEHLKDYAEYCRRLAEKTKGWYQPEYEIWSEPNNIPYGCFKGTFEQFVALCRTAADAVLAVTPQARLILGTTGDADVGFIKRLLLAGLSKQYKLIDIHPYRHSTQGPEDGLLADINRLKKVIAQYGDHQGILFSSIGWPTNPEYVGGNAAYEPVSFVQQACYFSRTMFISIAAGVERVHFHMLTSWPSVPNDPEANFGIIDARKQPKPSLCALSTTARHLEQAKFLGITQGLPDFHHFWYWRTAWEKEAVLLTAWCDTVMVKAGQVQWIPLPGKPLLAEDLWGERPDSSRLRHVNGRWEVLPGEDPIFIYISNNALPKNLAPLPLVMRPWHLRRLTAVPLKSKITIDGDLGEWKKLPGEITVSRSTGFGAMGFAGIPETEKKNVAEDTPRFAVGYDGQGLYLAVRVNSTKPMSNRDEGWLIWRGDCIRVYLGTVSSQEFPYISDNHFQFAIAPVTKGNGPPQAVNLGFETLGKVATGGVIPGAILAAKQLKDAWSLEAFIPWSFVGKSPKPSEIWSFDIEAGGLVWNGQQDNWHNPVHWGELSFLKP
jgi:hypothetical protein